MAPPVKSKWTPEAEKAAAEMWNANVDTNRILLTLKADYGLALKAQDIHSLYRRKGGQLNMIEGSDRMRAERSAHVVNRKIKITKTGRKEIVIEPPVQGVDLMDLRDGQCRYPLTKSLPHAFCGEKTSTGSWCAKHLEVIKGKRP